ncbi:MAG TPA: NAD(P)H-binding protein [Candidatus Limnocylindrales bacterium]
MRIAVTGATGNLGRQVVAHLAGQDVAELSSRNANYEDPQALRKALQGADKLVFISSDGEAAKIILHHQNVIAAAVDAGVGHIVLLSGVDADLASPFCYAYTNGATETLLRDTGIPFSIARAGLFAEFFNGLVRQSGGRMPMAGGRVGLVTRADVAECLAALALSAPTGTHHDLTGPEALGLADFGGTDITPAEFTAELAAGGEEQWWIYAYASMFESIRQQRWATVSGEVERLTTRKPSPAPRP